MVCCVFDSVGNRVHLPVLHDHLHPECSLWLSKHSILHPLKQHKRLLDGSVSPGGRSNVVALQLVRFLVAHVGVTPEERQRIVYCLPSLCMFTKNISSLHSPANKIHSKVIELLKVVWCMRDLIRCVACVIQWDWWEMAFVDLSIINSGHVNQQLTSPSHSTISLIAVKYFSSSFSGFVSSYLKKQIPLFAYRKRVRVKSRGREDLPTGMIVKEKRKILPLHSQNWSWWLWHVQCEGCHSAQEENEYESEGICG